MNRLKYGCSGDNEKSKLSNIADTLNQLDRHRKYSRIFFGESSFFFEFFRGVENIKPEEYDIHMGDGSGCFSVDPFLFI